MMRKPILLFALLVAMSSGLVACQQAEPAVEGTPAAEATAPVEQTTAPSTTRTGAWIDALTVVEEPNADAGVSRLEAGDLDVYAFPISSAGTYDKIVASEALDYKTSYGSFNELTFNPSACSDTTKLNPFAVPKVREAMNWLVDREYIVAEIMGGLGTPRYVPVNTASADRGRLAAEIREIEAKYAYDPVKAKEIISAEMQTLGATLTDGKWTFNGAPVEILGLIRTEDERKQIGDYFANQLESAGFTVKRDYKTSAEAAPIWQQSDPAECQFGYYTGGWVATSIDRDAGSNFNFYYTPAGLPRPLWQAYTPKPEFAAIAQRLNDNDFKTMDERKGMFAEALPMALEDSVRIWLLDRSSVAAIRNDIEVASDLSGSIYGSPLWPYTLRRKGQEGGEIKWASASILTEPWNPVAGTNWIYDTALIRALGQWSFVTDPNTGLTWPQRVDSFTVTAKEGLPIEKSLDWVNLEFVPEITVPDDAWVDWDAEKQTFLTAAEVYTQTETALVKLTSTYPADLFEKTKWHDGSPLSVGDMVMSLIMTFDQAKEASAIYDEAQVPAFDSFKSTFKGIKIVSTDPMTVEFYTDLWSLDAEGAISNGRTLWPSYGYGEAPWHTVALAGAAEGKNLAAFSADKAAAKEVEQFNFVAGPTVEIMTNELTEATAAGYIPYAPTMSQYVTPEEAKARYENLAKWFEARGHYWVGNGPFYLERAFPVEGTVSMMYNPDFPDPSDKWSKFAEPAIPVIAIDGPSMVAAGETATFDVSVTFNDAPYAQTDIQEVKYLVFDANGEMVATGAATGVADGQWQVELGPDVISALPAGSNRLEVIVVSKLVALPALDSYQFVTAP